MGKKLIKRTFTFEGKRYYIRGSTEKEVYEKMALKKRDLEEGRVILSGNMTVKAWTEQVLETYKPNVGEDYREQMKARINKHILSYIGSTPIKAVKPLQCQAILNRQKGMSKSHIEKLYHELFFIFDRARINNLIIANPAADLIKPEGYQNKRRPLSPMERKHWEKIMDTDDRFLLFQLMYFCGCRNSEAARVMRSDFSVKSGYPQLHIRGTKTENSDRFVPVPLELWNKVKGRTGLIATNQAGNEHTESSLRRLTDHLKREMNISMGCMIRRNQLIPPFPLAPDFTPYIFRHTYCTDLQRKGIDIRTARDLMGHASIKTTANIYTHTDEDLMEIAAKKIGAM